MRFGSLKCLFSLVVLLTGCVFAHLVAMNNEMGTDFKPLSGADAADLVMPAIGV
jgi:hypothetical protein